MFYMISLVLLFIIISAHIFLLPPDRMAEEEKLRPKLRDIGPVITLCQTAVFGRPKIRLLPPKEEVTLNLDFSSPETVKLSVPLRLIRQELDKARYLDVFAKYGLEVEERLNTQKQEVLNTNIRRDDENLIVAITSLYRDLFEAKDYHAVNLYVTTLATDSHIISAIRRDTVTNPEFQFKSRSQILAGKSLRNIMLGRVLMAANILLYPVIIIQSFNSFGLAGMCWAALVFFVFLVGARFILGQKLLVSHPFQNLIYIGLLTATIVTGQPDWVKYIPSVTSGMLAVYGLAQFLGLMENGFPQYKDKQSAKIIQLSLIVLGLGFLGLCEWARVSMSLDSWVWFFGFMRFELMIVASFVMIPVFIFLHQKLEKDSQNNA